MFLTRFLSTLALSLVLLFSVSIANINTLAQGYGADSDINLIRATDPYTCGAGLIGRVTVTGSITLSQVSTRVELINRTNAGITATFTPSLDASGNYSIANLHNNVQSGVYDVRVTAFETTNPSNNDTWIFQANVRKSSECPMLVTIRTGASNFMKENVVLSMAGIVMIFGLGYTLSKTKLNGTLER